MLILAALLVGAVSAGPDLAERAVAVDLPITEVVVFSDRARITRRGDVRGTGSRVLRAPDVPGGVMLDSVRVTSTGEAPRGCSRRRAGTRTQGAHLDGGV